LAFLGSHAEDVPFVLSIVSPSYVIAKDGLKEMERTMVLTPNQRGFDEVSALFFKQLSLWNPGKDVSSVSVAKITRKNAALGFGRLHAKEKVPYFGGITVIIMGKPPALPGDSQSLTFPGVYCFPLPQPLPRGEGRNGGQSDHSFLPL
jgi:hypothetical protein